MRNANDPKCGGAGAERVAIGLAAALLLTQVATSAGTSAMPGLVPWPKSLQAGAGSLTFRPGDRIAADGAELEPLARILAGEMWTVAGLRLPASRGSSGRILLRLTRDVEHEEGYRLRVAQRGVVIEAGTYRGAAWGTVTLLQSLRFEGGRVTLPCMTIADEPLASYRGLLIDPARNHHTRSYMRALIQMARLYKINYMQLHLNDTQGVRFHSKAFPKIAERYVAKGQAFTMDEWKEIVRYADERGVTLVPEIEGPGHHAGNLRALWGRRNTLDVYNEETYEGMKVLLGEVAEVFASSPYIHIGADEGSYGHLGQSPEGKAYMASREIKGGPLGHYIRRIDRIVKGLGKQTICWEGFHGDGGGLPRDIIVMPFESRYNPPHKLNAHGFPLICTPWKPLYVVNRRRWSPEYIYSNWNMWLWEHHTNTRCHIQLERESSNVLGAQMCAWEQKQEVDLRSVRGRLHAMAERTWAPDARLSYVHFAPRAERTDRLLDRMLALVRVEEQGLSGEVDRTYAKFPDTLILRLSSPPIGTIRYTTDGKDPTAGSRVCDAPITLTHRDTRHEKLFYDRRKGRHLAEGFTVRLKARLFDDAGEPVGDLVTHKRYWFTGGDLAISASGLSGEKEGDIEKFVGAVEVTIAQPDTEGTIRYTTDGTEPAATSREYDGPFTLTHEDTRVQKILYDRRIGRHREQGWVVTVRARRFDRANKLINGLGVTRTYWYVGPAKKHPPPLVPPRKRK